MCILFLAAIQDKELLGQAVLVHPTPNVRGVDSLRELVAAMVLSSKEETVQTLLQGRDALDKCRERTVVPRAARVLDRNLEEGPSLRPTSCNNRVPYSSGKGIRRMCDASSAKNDAAKDEVTFLARTCFLTMVWSWYGMVWYGMVLVWYGVVWCGVVWCGVVWYGLIECAVHVHRQVVNLAKQVAPLAA